MESKLMSNFPIGFLFCFLMRREQQVKAGVLVIIHSWKKYSVQFLVILSIYSGFIFIIFCGRAWPEIGPEIYGDHKKIKEIEQQIGE